MTTNNKTDNHIYVVNATFWVFGTSKYDALEKASKAIANGIKDDGNIMTWIKEKVGGLDFDNLNTLPSWEDATTVKVKGEKERGIRK